jgi:predicted NBD/HSP70 family sugar kinase
MYTSLAGLPWLLEQGLKKHPGHDLASSPKPMKERAFALRGLAQQGDALAIEIFDFQARAMGYFVAMLAMALDPEFVVIGGGLMEPEATTAEFRERYLRIVRESAEPYLWPAQRERLKVVAATLGDLSQAIGAALVALYTAQRQGRPC